MPLDRVNSPYYHNIVLIYLAHINSSWNNTQDGYTEGSMLIRYTEKEISSQLNALL